MTKEEKLKKIMTKNGYQGTKVDCFSECKECKGRCCKTNACAYIPTDFDGPITESKIEELINNGKAMIFGTLIRSGPRKYKVLLYVSAPEKDAKNGVKIGIMHSTCALLSKNGCKLSRDERPSQGLALIPENKYSCKNFMDFGKDVLATWEKYNDVLEAVVKKRTGKTSEELLNEELYDPIYAPISGKEKLTLPMFLKQRIQSYYIKRFGGIPAPVNRGVKITKLTAQECLAIEALFNCYFYEEHIGEERAGVLKEMFDLI